MLTISNTSTLGDTMRFATRFTQAVRKAEAVSKASKDPKKS